MKFDLFQQYKKHGRTQELTDEYMARYGESLFDEEKHRELFEEMSQEQMMQQIREAAVKKMNESKKRRESFQLERDNLRFKALAQYRVINDGNVLQYEEIDNNLCPKPKVKGLALNSQSAEEIETMKDQDYFDVENLSVAGSDEYARVDEASEDRNRRRQIRKKKRQMRKEQVVGPRMDDNNNSDKDPDIHSSMDFWQEIEPHVNHGAELLDFSGTFKKDADVLDEVALDFAKNSSPAVNKKAKAAPVSNVQDQIMVRELKKELELERRSNAQREKNARLLAKKYTLEFFREKSALISEVAQAENNYVYRCYDDIRERFFRREKKTGLIAKLLQKQERIILDYRMFIDQNMKQIFQTLDGRTVDRILEVLPTDEHFS